MSDIDLLKVLGLWKGLLYPNVLVKVGGEPVNSDVVRGILIAMLFPGDISVVEGPYEGPLTLALKALERNSPQTEETSVKENVVEVEPLDVSKTKSPKKDEAEAVDDTPAKKRGRPKKTEAPQPPREVPQPPVGNLMELEEDEAPEAPKKPVRGPDAVEVPKVSPVVKSPPKPIMDDLEEDDENELPPVRKPPSPPTKKLPTRGEDEDDEDGFDEDEDEEDLPPPRKPATVRPPAKPVAKKIEEDEDDDFDDWEDDE